VAFVISVFGASELQSFRASELSYVAEGLNWPDGPVRVSISREDIVVSKISVPDLSSSVLSSSTDGPVAVFWFRRDLRLEDNVGLAAALRSGRPVLPLFIFDDEILGRLHDADDGRVLFIHRTLSELRERLREIASDLLVVRGRPLDVWKNLIGHFKIDSVYVNRDYEPYANQRDLAVAKLLSASGVQFHTHKDQVIFEKREVAKDDGKPYTVFTPFSRKWKATLAANESILATLSVSEQAGHKNSAITKFREGFLKWSARGIPALAEIGFKDRSIEFPAPVVERRLLANYERDRNTPSLPGTSRLGLHLRFGTLSVRELVSIARKTSETWLNELIWREFFMQILWNFPHVVGGSFRPEYDKIKFRHDEADFARWCEGKTGVPIVDAGMRELNETGFMHNRVRMIAGSYLVKHLLIDWRWGEAYFARKLLDFDLASNNGNWQWVAGTGCDAAPYFRVFNPTTQEKKFDPDRKYIKKWVPEVNSMAYPEPMVDHVFARNRALKAYAIGLGREAPAASKSDE
jgi:deoxyribodipyrimidine photo-lyase